MLKTKSKIIAVILATIVILGTLSACTSAADQKTQEINAKMSEAEKNFQEGKYADAVAIYGTVLELDDQYADAFVKRAQAQLELGKTEQAQLDLKKAKALLETPTLAYYQTEGLLHLALKERVEALNSFDQAIAIADASSEPVAQEAQLYSVRALTNYELHHDDAAVNDVKKAIEIDATNAMAYVVQAQMAVDNGEYSAAIEYADQALAINDKLADALAIKGYATFKDTTTSTSSTANNTNVEDAQKMLNDALTIKQTPLVYNYLGLIALEQKEYQTADDYFDKAIELDNKEARYLNNRALSLYSLSTFEEALVDSNTAITLDPLVGAYYFNRGLILEQLQLNAAAKIDFNKAIELEPNLKDSIPTANNNNENRQND